MIAIAKHSSTRVETAKGDVRTIHSSKTWEQFQHLQKGFENSRGVRLFYFDGTIEILTPGKAHELFKSVVGFLIETCLFQQGVEFEPTGSMTQEKPRIASVEADESYTIQELTLSIEVNFTSGDISKLARYKALAVNEVWFWKDGVLEIYHLQDGSYQKVNNSLIPALSSLSVSTLSECIMIGETSRLKAAQKMLKSIQQSGNQL